MRDELDFIREFPKPKPQKKSLVIQKNAIMPKFGNDCILKYLFPNANYYFFKTWNECFPDGNVNLRMLIYNNAWTKFFDAIQEKKYFKKMERELSKILKSGEIIVPHAEILFNVLNVLSPINVKVVIIGQDPYPQTKIINGKDIPQAVGFSFSAPLNYPTPQSLQNIYSNLYKFKHIQNIPKTGCLSTWVMQGCFLLNAALTTIKGKRNVHGNIWDEFIDDLLTYLNNNFMNIVFIVWGKDANDICKYIDPKKHHIITSSHPSPMGFNKTVKGFSYGYYEKEEDRPQIVYPPFESVDHFGQANEYLKSVGLSPILWDMINH